MRVKQRPSDDTPCTPDPKAVRESNNEHLYESVIRAGK